jgi:beta-glucosidase-like glycosyl hydrolase
VVDLLRDPRAGRNEEAYSEDPLLIGACSTAYARGLRGEHRTYLKTAPTLKHFFAYNNETDRDTTSASFPPRLLREYYLNAFLPALRAGAAVAVMPSYNLVNGRPAHVSPYIEELRACAPGEVLVVSDAHAPTNLVASQRYFASHAHAHAAALRAGLDSFTDRDGDASFTTGALHEPLAAGLLSEADVDRALRHIIAIRLRLGDLDPPGRNPWTAIDTVVNCDEHRALAREAVRRSILLLRYDGLLPLPVSTSSVAVVGPLCDDVREDWYSGTLPYAVTPAGGIRDALGRTAVGTEEGHDHIALRARDAGRYVTVFDGAHLRLAGAPSRGPGLHQQFDLLDWGEDVCSLRSRSAGMCVSLHPLDGDATDPPLVADQRGPNGWTVHETFSFVDDHDGTVVLRNIATGRWWRTAVDGTLVATRHRAAATRFEVARLSDGAARAAGVAARADAAIVVLGNHPMVNGRETQDRNVITLPPAQERLLRAVVAANPRTVLVVETGYPVAIGWADARPASPSTATAPARGAVAGRGCCSSRRPASSTSTATRCRRNRDACSGTACPTSPADRRARCSSSGVRHGRVRRRSTPRWCPTPVRAPMGSVRSPRSARCSSASRRPARWAGLRWLTPTSRSCPTPTRSGRSRPSPCRRPTSTAPPRRPCTHMSPRAATWSCGSSAASPTSTIASGSAATRARSGTCWGSAAMPSTRCRTVSRRRWTAVRPDGSGASTCASPTHGSWRHMPAGRSTDVPP